MLAPEMRRSLFFNRRSSEPPVGTGSAKAEGFHAAFTLRALGAALLRGPDPELRHRSVHYERHRKRRVPEQRVLCVGRVGNYE